MFYLRRAICCMHALRIPTSLKIHSEDLNREEVEPRPVVEAEQADSPQPVVSAHRFDLLDRGEAGFRTKPPAEDGEERGGRKRGACDGEDRPIEVFLDLSHTA